MTKVFGVGWAKTGTTTLGKCFEILGYDHQSLELELVKDIAAGDLSRIMALAETKETFEDWPWALLYKELDQAFPGSRFVLTKRKPGSWIRSYANMLANQGHASPEMNETRRALYGLPFPGVSEAQLLARYEQHNAEVEACFQERPDDLLVVDWEETDEWKVLCAFLGRDVPDQPFPRANEGSYFTGLSLARARNSLGKVYRYLRNKTFRRTTPS